MFGTKFFILTATLVAIVKAKYCSSGYHYFEDTDACYGASFHYIGHWKDADENCQKEGGHLASIHSDTEANFISNLVFFGSEKIWIGLKYRDNEWKWSDGSNFDWSNWAASENNSPSDDDKDVHCAIFDQGKIHRLPCETVGSFHYSVCKKQAFDDE